MDRLGQRDLKGFKESMGRQEQQVLMGHKVRLDQLDHKD
jgi:hypothetical protein